MSGVLLQTYSFQYHISRLAETVAEDSVDDDKNKDIDEALHELEDSLGMGGNNPKVGIVRAYMRSDFDVTIVSTG